MPKFILWNVGDSNLDSQESFNKIAYWWAGLEGKKIQFSYLNGSIKIEHGDGIPTSNPSFTIRSPALKDTSLIFKGLNESYNIPVQKLKLDLDNNQLEVYSSDSSKHVFTPKPEYGFFKSETIF